MKLLVATIEALEKFWLGKKKIKNISFYAKITMMHILNHKIMNVIGNPATLLGEFKAPSKIGDDFLWFCEEHIKIYNKEWDFFEGMSQGQIEDFMFQDIVGHKKTQKFGSMDNFFHQLWNNAIEDELLIISKFKQTLAKDDQKYSEKQITALKKMELKPNVSWVAVKEQFKKLVKKYHPDMNAGNKQYEEKLKEITIAYSYLKTSLTDRQKTV